MIIHQTTNVALIRQTSGFEPNMSNIWLIINFRSKAIGLFELQEVSKIASIVHMHIISGYQKQDLGLLAFKKLVEYLSLHSKIKTLIGTIPAKNSHIMSIVNRTAAKCCGNIPNGIIFNNELQDLLLFNLEVTA